ncbi:N-6 DNA methylase [Archangium gephyra]|uniref:site-specific DNA-methyltransferase (adenine-specific) n=1 Tax=Archangium gephyra TaxID=48 RepID=A0AAC8TFM8_9BACT|nr:N-6 DNA methylase [Archangium gephyra]AKJ03975.1 Type I restriction-modification system, DNA-methyltransferase subunit M [Archangium gephyra]REG14205.1 N-6 DNA methylase [Archangium gephyra]
MSDVKSELKKVWSAFDRVGVADDLTIIEHVAALLLRMESRAHQGPEMLQARYPRGNNLVVDDLVVSLRAAAQAVGGSATLLNEHVLFWLTEMIAGRRYPTPRHLVRTMSRLADVRAEHDLADLSCGSGGFLVQRLKDSEASGATIGVDISVEWARLALANATLHGARNIRILADNALDAFGPGGNLSDQRFDRILMNPSFGIPQSEELVLRTLGISRANRSEVALTLLAVRCLREGGRAAVLVPSGVLYREDGAEIVLRKQLVDDCSLLGVVSLPRDAFQPFSLTQTHLILVDRLKPQDSHRTWFFQLQDDGYRAGRARELTQRPREPNDLVLIEHALLARGSGSSSFPAGDYPILSVRRLSAESRSLGYLIEGVNGGAVRTVELRSRSRVTSLWVQAIHLERGQHINLNIPLSEGEPEEESSAELRLSRDSASALSSSNIYSGEEKNQAIVISADGRLLGVTIPSRALRANAYELRPQRYITVQPDTQADVPPARILAAISRHQRELLERIHLLMGRLERPPVTGDVYPEPLWEGGLEQLTLLGRLGWEQHRIWEVVSAQVTTIEPMNPPRTMYRTAARFGPTDVGDSNASTLSLLERMGLVVKVSIADGQSLEPRTYYRRVTERDRWNFEEDSVENEGGK